MRLVVQTRVVFALTGILIAASAFAVMSLIWSSSSKHIEQNEALFESLPVFPSAQLISLDSHPYFLNEGRTASGYGTLATFRAPSGTSPEQVLDFMETNLRPAWIVTRHSTPCLNLQDGAACPPMIGLQAVNGTAFVGVNTDNLGPSGNGTFEVYVDQDSYLASDR